MAKWKIRTYAIAIFAYSVSFYFLAHFKPEAIQELPSKQAWSSDSRSGSQLAEEKNADDRIPETSRITSSFSLHGPPSFLKQFAMKYCTILFKIQDFGNVCKPFVPIFSHTVSNNLVAVDDDFILAYKHDFDERGSHAHINLWHSGTQMLPYTELARSRFIKKIFGGVISEQNKLILANPRSCSFSLERKYNETMRTAHRDYAPDALAYHLILSYRYWKASNQTSIFTAEWKQAAMAILQVWSEDMQHATSGNLVVGPFRPEGQKTNGRPALHSNIIISAALRQLAEMDERFYHDEFLFQTALKIAATIENSVQNYKTSESERDMDELLVSYACQSVYFGGSEACNQKLSEETRQHILKSETFTLKKLLLLGISSDEVEMRQIIGRIYNHTLSYNFTLRKSDDVPVNEIPWSDWDYALFSELVFKYVSLVAPAEVVALQKWIDEKSAYNPKIGTPEEQKLERLQKRNIAEKGDAAVRSRVVKLNIALVIAEPISEELDPDLEVNIASAALQENLNSPYIRSVHARIASADPKYFETRFNGEKGKIIDGSGKFTVGEAIKYANEHLKGSVVLITKNSDVYFDSSIRNLLQMSERADSKLAYFLSPQIEECRDYRGVHDVIAFYAPLPQNIAEETLELDFDATDLEERLVEILQKEKVAVLNPCKQIRAFHLQDRKSDRKTNRNLCVPTDDLL
eukprot:TRINITY_DN775_c0_g2_i1.p1 TRINITY_DN775_c0_g2~~TRINITY_DN775_c0_g2_i1.p1  ORF type:complete len:691 (+),score=150.29 TRINITY_DN775_c0_g2_i1:93-2165(+)